MARKEWLQIRCSGMEKEEWTRVAEAKGMSLSAYVRGLLNTIVRREEEKQRELGG